MSGTIIAFQDFVGFSVRFRRSTGLEPDFSEVIVQNVGATTPLAEVVRGKISALSLANLAGDIAAELIPFGGALESIGELVMGEDAGLSGSIRIQDLHVTNVQQADPGNPGSPTVITLADERLFWDRGFLRRWRFNIPDAAGNDQRDTLDPAGQPWTLKTLLEHLFSRLRSRPRVVRFPAGWENIPASFTFDRFMRPRDAIRRVLDKYPAKVSLHLDRTVGIYLEGDGRVGRSRGDFDSDGGNDEALADGTIEDRGGTGNVRGSAFGYPFKRVLVAGGRRIASVAVDQWEPVVMIEGTPVNIDVALAEMLGVQPAKLEDSDRNWLRRFVLRPDAYKGSRRLNPQALAILKRDAYRLWRLPFADTFNRHLLPMRDRAETKNGVRLPIRLETFRFKKLLLPASFGFDGTRVRVARNILLLQERLARAEARGDEVLASRLRAELWAARPEGVVSLAQQSIELNNSAMARLSKQVADRLRGRGAIGQEQRTSINDEIKTKLLQKNAGVGFVIRLIRETIPAGNRAEIVEGALEAARSGFSMLEPEFRAKAAEFNEEAADYRKALDARNSATATLQNQGKTHTEDVLYAEACIEAGLQIRTGNANPRAAGERALRALQRRQRILKRFREADPEERQVEQEPKFATVAYMLNVCRTEDPNFIVESKELGIIRTQAPVGHLDEEGTPDTSGRQLVPLPVRVTFGTLISPRRGGAVVGPELPPPPKIERCDDKDLGDRYPAQVVAALADGKASADGRAGELGTYNRSFALAPQSQGIVNISLDDADRSPLGEEVFVVSRPDLVELISLDGDSNANELNRKAQDAALAAFNESSSRADTRRVSYLSPLRVNCNGRISGVEIVSREGGRGFRTVISLGFKSKPFAFANKQQIRGANQVPGPQPDPNVEDAAR